MTLKWRLLLATTMAMSISPPVVVAQSMSYFTPNLLPGELTRFDADRDPKCPPCFNCNIENNQCQQFGNCTSTTGHCTCPAGFGDIDCAQVLCGSPAQGLDRPMRPETSRDVPVSKRPQCECEDGWSGINCNVCKTNKACIPLKPEGSEDNDMVCYKDGVVVKENFHQCDIANDKIIEALDPEVPQATVSCNNERKDCTFQMWVGGIESFYCALDACEFKVDNQDSKNITEYTCENVKCECIKERKLCESSGLDIGPLLREQIKGPGILRSTSTEGGSKDDVTIFSEPALDGLVSSVFGDDSILLKCDTGECLYKTMVPGFEKAVKTINTPLIAGVISGSSLFIVAAILVVWWFTRRNNRRRYGPLQVGEEEDELLMADHKPAALHFEQVSYAVNGKQILHGVQGAVRPGELMAIMGASGAGKTTFLDILARKNKKGVAQGDFYVNGERVSDSDFRNVIGFVDQDDVMLPTLTVHETILDSAKLRLPADMSMAAKEQKVEDVEKQLGIYHVRDSVIGAEEVNGRGISGGEKRRVGIACELITSPSILFLDEPTSGLDAYNAFNVIECLVTLVKTYHRTVVFTIHQPRSNIVALFDQLVLLAKGRTVYSGPFSSCQSYFDSIGYACPPGFNIADYLVDLTMHAGRENEPLEDIFDAAEPNTRSSSLAAIKSIGSAVNISSAERDGEESSDASNKAPERPSIGSPRVSSDRRRVSIKDEQDRKLFGRKKRPDVPSPTAEAEEEQSLLSDAKYASSGADGTNLDNIIASYFSSDVATSVFDDMRKVVDDAAAANGNTDGSVKGSSNRIRGYRKTGVIGQFGILAIRTWRNLYRNPFLMLTHYAIAIVLAVFLGVLFYGLQDDVPGFQNRLGFFFFVLALFGFSTLTSLTTFAQERLLFMRERAKGYYWPVSYFSAKVFFDIVPLRLIPPAIFGAIVYPMTGLVPDWGHFSTFMAFLILFNFAAAGICLLLGVIFRNGGLANLVGSLTMLFSLLFSGLLLNKDSMPGAVQWLQYISIFHFGYEGLMVNEVRQLSLSDHKYGLDIQVPGAVILTTFGFDVQALWLDMIGLGAIAAGFLVLGYGAMHFLLVERR